MSDLIPLHGGLSSPVCRMVPDNAQDAFRESASKLTRVPVSDADLSTVYRFGDGGLSPLTGPMDSETWHRVLDKSVIEFNGKPYAWTIPLALPVSSDLAGQLEVGQTVALVDEAGQIVGAVDISDVYPWDKPAYLKSVYLTERTDHPGADMVLEGDAGKTHLLGGEITVLPQPKHSAFGRYMHTPAEVRRLLSETGWKRVVAFQTRNPLHRAHEYALVYGLEALIRQGIDAGRLSEPAGGRDQIGRRQRGNPDADLRGADRVQGVGRGGQRRGIVATQRRGRAGPGDAHRTGHQDVLRRPQRGGHARDIPPELRLYGHYHRTQTRGCSLSRRQPDLGAISTHRTCSTSSMETWRSDRSTWVSRRSTSPSGGWI